MRRILALMVVKKHGCELKSVADSQICQRQWCWWRCMKYASAVIWTCLWFEQDQFNNVPGSLCGFREVIPGEPRGYSLAFNTGGPCHYSFADPQIWSLMFWGPQILSLIFLETLNIAIYFWDPYNVFEWFQVMSFIQMTAPGHWMGH